MLNHNIAHVNARCPLERPLRASNPSTRDGTDIHVHIICTYRRYRYYFNSYVHNISYGVYTYIITLTIRRPRYDDYVCLLNIIYILYAHTRIVWHDRSAVSPPDPIIFHHRHRRGLQIHAYHRKPGVAVIIITIALKTFNSYYAHTHAHTLLYYYNVCVGYYDRTDAVATGEYNGRYIRVIVYYIDDLLWGGRRRWHFSEYQIELQPPGETGEAEKLKT